MTLTSRATPDKQSHAIGLRASPRWLTIVPPGPTEIINTPAVFLAQDSTGWGAKKFERDFAGPLKALPVVQHKDLCINETGACAQVRLHRRGAGSTIFQAHTCMGTNVPCR
jgi:hypothetical protein